MLSIFSIIGLLLVPPGFLAIAIAVRNAYSRSSSPWMMGALGLGLLIVAWFLIDINKFFGAG